MDIWIRESRVEVFLCDDGYWKNDIVFLFSKIISEKEKNDIMEYLYEEGFIQDRRTRFFLTTLED
jgi:hypothetical protein